MLRKQPQEQEVCMPRNHNASPWRGACAGNPAASFGYGVHMEDIEARSESAARLEGERSCSETARETGIARALIASEKKPQPVEEWLEKEINGKVFKLGRTLDSETQDQIAKVISRHLDAFAWAA